MYLGFGGGGMGWGSSVVCILVLLGGTVGGVALCI